MWRSELAVGHAERAVPLREGVAGVVADQDEAGIEAARQYSKRGRVLGRQSIVEDQPKVVGHAWPSDGEGLV